MLKVGLTTGLTRSAARVFVSPLCQYSSRDGMPNDWYLVHPGSRAVCDAKSLGFV
jgi:2,4-dienoyl-CoA reductase-like NADH-dependent reductase (Old Yellow Enzyme family)